MTFNEHLLNQYQQCNICIYRAGLVSGENSTKNGSNYSCKPTQACDSLSDVFKTGVSLSAEKNMLVQICNA